MADSGFGTLGRFEVYSIVIEKLSGDLGMITLKVGSETEQLFNQKAEKIEMGKPLQLSGPIQPISPYDPIYIVFGNPKKSEWKLFINYDDAEKLHQIDRPITVEVKDPKSASVAVVCYGLLSEAVDAKFLFSLEDPYSGRYSRNCSGEIFVTTGDGVTKCLLQSFNRNSVVESRVPIKLARSRVSMSVDSYLEVTANLDFDGIKMIHSHPLFVPPPTPSISPFTDLDAAVHLRVEVNWNDELANIIDKKLKNIMPAIDALRDQLKLQGINPMEDVLFPGEVDADAAEGNDAAAECKRVLRTSVFGLPIWPMQNSTSTGLP